MRSTEIYFNDLNPEAQKRVLEFYGMKDESEGNWEVEPLAILEVVDAEDEPQEKFSWEAEEVAEFKKDFIEQGKDHDPPFNYNYHNWEAE